MLNKLKIRTKLALGFAVLLLFIVVMGIFGYIALSSVDKGLDGLALPEEVTQHMSEAVNKIFLDNKQSIRNTAALYSWLIILIGVVAVAVGVVIAVVLILDIITGLQKAGRIMSKVANDGDLSVEIDPDLLRRIDAVGDLVRGMKAILDDYSDINNVANTLAEGNWQVTVKTKGELDSTNICLNKMIARVNDVLRQVIDSVGQVSSEATEVLNASQHLSDGSQQAAASLEEITASMHEISSQTKTNAESATQARDLVQQASQAATKGQESMQEMVKAMNKITQNSLEVQRVIKVIDDIAFQTNLLALNAAVEAARAGQHGKGFAVVAEEVRNLASRSAKAAHETSDLIANSGREIEKGDEIATRTAEVLNTIVEHVKTATDLVSGIAAASNEQAQGVGQVTIGLQQIDTVTQQNTASAEESATAANTMSGMATSLQKLVGQFKLR